MGFKLLPKTLAFNTATTHVFLSLLFSLLISLAGAQSPTDGSRRPEYGYARLTPAMAIIIVVLIAALFFLACFSIYIRHCATSSAAATSLRLRNAADPGRSRRLNRGLEPSVIATFPTLVYSQVKGLKIGKHTLECAVCLNEFEDHDTLRFIPKCEHVFHPECIDAWLATHTTCPVCRADLVPQPGESPPSLTELGAELEDPCSEEDEQHEHQAQGTQEVILEVDRKLNRSRTRGSRSGRPPRFPRSHSTGHSLVRPGVDTDRFTLKLPEEVRREIMSKRLSRATSLSEFPRQGSSRRGYRGNYNSRFDELDRRVKSDRWGFGKVGPFLSRMSSSVRSLSMKSISVRSPKVAAESGEGTSASVVEPAAVKVGSTRLPV